MAGMDDVLSRLTDNPSFLDWLSGKASGRGVPSWDPTTAGRSGGFPGREPGMPRAPGNSPSQMQTRFGGTYAPSGNTPVPANGGLALPQDILGREIPIDRGGWPKGTGSWTGPGGFGAGGLPASLSGMLGNAARTPGIGIGRAIMPAAGIAQQHDIGSPRHTPQEMIDWLMKRNVSPQTSSGGAMMPMPIPSARAAPAPPQPVKDQSNIPAQPSWSGMAQMPNSLPPTPQSVPLPVARPQQGVPLPTPRPSIPPRPQMPVARPTPRPVHPAEQAAQNKSILDTLLSSFDPNAAWRQQYR